MLAECRLMAIRDRFDLVIFDWAGTMPRRPLDCEFSRIVRFGDFAAVRKYARRARVAVSPRVGHHQK
jgi:hypothetical protein